MYKLVVPLIIYLLIVNADENPAPKSKNNKGLPATPIPAVINVINPLTQTRHLTLDFLLNSNDISTPVTNLEFLPLTGKNTGAPATVNLDGTFTFFNINFQRYKFSLIWDDESGTGGLPLPFDTPTRELLPSFSVQVVQDGKFLYPVPSGWVNIGYPTSPDHPWEFIFSPGECWHEVTDQNYDRCVLNVALVEGQQNSKYDLLVTFLVSKSTRVVSQAWLQSMTTEAGYYQWNSWGFADVTFAPSSNGPIQSTLKQSVVTSYRNLINARIPVKPIEEIPGWQSGWTRTNNPMYNYTEHGVVSTGGCSPAGWGYNYLFTHYGVMHWNGNYYAGPTMTQVGEHPYPEWYVTTGYSWTKSIWAGLSANMDLIHGCNYPSTPTATDNNKCLFDLQVSDWIEGADSTWSGVTLGVLINQASNHFNSSEYGVDEGNHETNSKFFYIYPQQEKMSFAVNGTNYHPEVTNGQQFNYKTVHFYMQSRILQRVASQVLGMELVDIYRQNFCIPLGLSEMHCNVRTTEDLVSQPLGGFGTYFYMDDLAKIANFWAFSGGKVATKQILSTDFYLTTMQMNPAKPGISTLRCGDPMSTCFPSRCIPIPGQRYQNGFWSDQSTGIGYANADIGICTNSRTIFMSGYSGQRMQIIPGVLGEYGGAYIQKNDNYDYKVASALAFLMKSSLGCPRNMNP